ncbi:T9SS C-terminal target domain-containing protein, partial [bacterium]
DWDIYAYRISPAGTFVWGADGIAISNNDNFEPDPQVCVTSDGGIVFAWQEETALGNVVNLRKLTTAGVDMFFPTVITLSSEFGNSIPRLAAADSGSVILQFLEHQGSQFWSPRHIYMQKYNAAGVELWFEDPTAVMTTGGIGVQMKPDVIHDGNGGAYSYWYDTRNMDHHCFVQHVTNMGVAEWTTNGVQTDMSAAELQMNPALTVTSDGVVIFYAATNTGQTQGGMQVQKLNTSGARQWGDNGIVLIPLMTDPTLYLYAFTQGSNATVAYGHYVNGSAINWVVRAIQVDNATGDEIWEPSPRDVCSVVSDKGHLNVCVNPFDQVIAAWPDSRVENGDIYMQNINPDGSLGPLGELPPTITITSPTAPNDTVLVGNEVVIQIEVENFVLAETGGDGMVEFILDGQFFNYFYDTQPITLTLASEGIHEAWLELLDNSHLPFNPRIYDVVWLDNSTPPWINIVSPAQDTTVHSGVQVVTCEIGNFVLGVDGIIRLTAMRGEHSWSVTSPGSTTLPPVFLDEEGVWMFVAELIDPVDPVASDTVMVNYVAPTIEITQPAGYYNWYLFLDSLDIHFETEFIEFSGPNGNFINVDIRFRRYFTQPEEPYANFDHFSSDSIWIDFDEIGSYFIKLRMFSPPGPYAEAYGEDSLQVDIGEVAVDDTPDGIPTSFALLPAYPNPFNPETTIRFDVAAPAQVTLTVHDLLGRTVATLLNDFRDAGQYSVVWQGTDNYGQSMPSGVYFVKMNADAFSATQKLMLIR